MRLKHAYHITRKLNYWSRDANVSKACCNHTTNIEKGLVLHVFSDKHTTQRRKYFSKCYLSFNHNPTGKHVSESEGVDHPLHFCWPPWVRLSYSPLSQDMLYPAHRSLHLKLCKKKSSGAGMEREMAWKTNTWWNVHWWEEMHITLRKSMSESIPIKSSFFFNILFKCLYYKYFQMERSPCTGLLCFFLKKKSAVPQIKLISELFLYTLGDGN